ncbi:hypothetical protein ACFQE5_05535 [Pseudonocardia hispaniensis]|uniref:Uncharacterized protein n=1 Tax=Pseudonocardia hispaniensis TaxID=904933 RepID=A0ABW1IYT6_9PSEU
MPQVQLTVPSRPPGARITADTEPRFRVDGTVPAGASNDERRADLVKDQA